MIQIIINIIIPIGFGIAFSITCKGYRIAKSFKNENAMNKLKTRGFLIFIFFLLYLFVHAYLAVIGLIPL